MYLDNSLLTRIYYLAKSVDPFNTPYPHKSVGPMIEVYGSNLQGVKYTPLSALRGSEHQEPRLIDLIWKTKTKKHTTVRIRWWSPTQLLTHRRVA